MATRSGWREPDCCELLVRGKVGDLKVNLSCPQLAWHLREGRNGPLGKVSIPLGPRGLLAIGQAEGIHYGAALPAVVRRWVSLR